jgi:hypothetical protein
MSGAVKMGFPAFGSTTATATSRLDLCAAPDARFGCALTMVMDECGASRGVLYLVGDHGPFEAASCGEPEESLRAIALDCLADGMADADSTGLIDSFTTGDSPDFPEEAKGELIRPVLLTHEGEEGFVVTGVAVVAISNDIPFSFPAVVAREISRHLRTRGDVVGIVVAG